MNTLKSLHQLWNNFRSATALSICCLIFAVILLNAQVYGPFAVILFMGSPIIALGVFGVVEWIVQLCFFFAACVIEKQERLNNKEERCHNS